MANGGHKPTYYLLAPANPFQGSNCPYNLVTRSLKSTSTVCFTNCMIALVMIYASTIVMSRILLSKATTSSGLLSYYTRLAFVS